VWTTALLFFQWLLVAGYAFAHGIARYLAPGIRSAVFLAAAVAAVCLLRFGRTPSGGPTSTTNRFGICS
jgi:hypothetical protein